MDDEYWYEHIENLREEWYEREEAYKELVRFLKEHHGTAPYFGSEGLWVELYDEIFKGY